MAWRVVVNLKKGIPDPRAQSLKKKIAKFLQIEVDEISTSDVFTIDANLTKNEIELIAKEPLCDPVIQEFKINPTSFSKDFQHYLEVGFLPGVTDNVGKTAKEAIEILLNKKLLQEESVYTSILYGFKGKLTLNDVKRIANELLYNPLIQQYHYYSPKDKAIIYLPKVTLKNEPEVKKIDLAKLSDADLLRLSKERLLALNLEELKAIQNYFANKKFVEERKKIGLTDEITDVELEALAQTWSEHCKHKIFNATITYENEKGKKEKIKSLFKTFIKASTEKIAKKRKDDFLVSVFVDNAGVISFNKDYNVVFKVETHNSPSALDPYGGALTGIVGVNRDVLGTGLGAKLIFNTDVFCFGNPFYEKKLPPRILHPQRIYDGVVTGVEHGGNKSGIPTVNGSIVFDDRFIGKPLVYCGTGGIMPKMINNKKSHEKTVADGDLIVMVGGRIGKDGIHGATFSSEELHEGSPVTAVQIGDPITQKKMADFLYKARDLGLYNAITDNGAGGLSSSVGEMSELSGGCVIELDKAPLKYSGLNPWEILLSESQERMTLAVPPKKIKAFLELSKKYDVESTVIGKFTKSGYFHVLYKNKSVAYLPLNFLHHGLPEMKLTAKFIEKKYEKLHLPKTIDCGDILKKLLGSLNICSKESVVRRYDHEVQGMSVIKPFVGVKNDGPSDGAVIKPLPENNEGIVVSHGICPKFSDYDTYNMAALALDEAIRNAICCGGDLKNMACLDNFCWCDPIKSDKNPDGDYKLALLVRANKALYDYTIAYGVPCISGKDSMKNDYIMGDIKISIPPTLLFSLISIVKDVNKCVTMDFKEKGNIIFIVGVTKDELAGSEYLNLLNQKGGTLPTVDAKINKKVYQKITECIEKGYINAAHDCSDGGLAVSLAEMAFSGGFGCIVDLTSIPYHGCGREDFILFSESAGRIIFTTKSKYRNKVKNIFKNLPIAEIGETTDKKEIILLEGKKVVLKEEIDLLKSIWQKTLKDL